jgi:hypothetical protein
MGRGVLKVDGYFNKRVDDSTLRHNRTDFSRLQLNQNKTAALTKPAWRSYFSLDRTLVQSLNVSARPLWWMPNVRVFN